MILPDFLCKSLCSRYGYETALKIQTGYAMRRPVTFRVNTLKTTSDAVENSLCDRGISLTRAPLPNAFIVNNAREQELFQTPQYERGEIYLQSLSSMLPPYLIDPKEGENVLDMTAAPGGKTAELSALSGGKAFITAVEKNKLRFDRLQYNLNKQSVPRVSAINADALSLSEFFRFDKILLDAPCSGSGTLNADEPVKISEKLVKNSAELQGKLIKKALKLIKSGSILVYSTCSVLREENEENVQKVLSSGQAVLLPAQLPFKVPRLKSMKGTLLIPPTDLFEGFFCAVLRKK